MGDVVGGNRDKTGIKGKQGIEDQPPDIQRSRCLLNGRRDHGAVQGKDQAGGPGLFRVSASGQPGVSAEGS